MKGEFVSHPPLAPIAADHIHGGDVSADVLDFSISINPLGPPPAALAAFHAAAEAITRYPPAYPSRLAARIGEWLGVNPGNVVVGNGSTQLIHLLARDFHPGAPHVAIPTFSEIANAIIFAGQTPYAIELPRERNFTLTVDQVSMTLRRGARSIYIGRPNSPTGSTFAFDEAAAMVRECHRFGAGCVFDEAFFDFVEGDESAVRLLGVSPELVVVRSLTKIFTIPGLRIGYIVAAEDFAGRMRERLEPWSVNAVAERVAMACLDGADDFIRRTREFVSAERTWLAARLGGVEGLRVYPSAANFLMLEVEETHGRNASGFADFMMRHRIAVRDLRSLPGSATGMYRIGLRTRADHERLVSAIEAYRRSGAR